MYSMDDVEKKIAALKDSDGSVRIKAAFTIRTFL